MAITIDKKFRNFIICNITDIFKIKKALDLRGLLEI